MALYIFCIIIIIIIQQTKALKLKSNLQSKTKRFYITKWRHTGFIIIMAYAIWIEEFKLKPDLDCSCNTHACLKNSCICHMIHVTYRWQYTLTVVSPISRYWASVTRCYPMEMCQPVSNTSGCSCSRSSARSDLAVPRTKTLTYGPRTFAVSGPTSWNSLPQPQQLGNFNAAVPFGLWEWFDCALYDRLGC